MCSYFCCNPCQTSVNLKNYDYAKDANEANQTLDSHFTVSDNEEHPLIEHDKVSPHRKLSMLNKHVFATTTNIDRS